MQMCVCVDEKMLLYSSSMYCVWAGVKVYYLYGVLRVQMHHPKFLKTVVWA